MEQYASFSISDDTFLSSYGMRALFSVLRQQARKPVDSDSFASRGPHTDPFRAVTIFPTFTRRFFLIRSLIFSLFLSVDAVRGRPQWGWLSTSVYPSLKYLTHCLTLSAPICLSICTLKCMSFRHADFLMLPKRRVFASHILALKCNQVSVASDLISLVVWKVRWTYL